MAYAYPWFGHRDFGVVRWLGPGLGNLLFPWTRAVVACERDGLTLIDPTWPSIKVGPLLRRERDLRFYGRLFRSAPHSVVGLRKLARLLTLHRVSEDEFWRTPGQARRLPPASIVVFEGLRNYFRDIQGEHELVRRRLLEITRDEHKAALSCDFTATIAVHVRRGDFALGAVTTPIEWYVDVLQALRAALGRSLAVNVFSDGGDEELAPLLDLPKCRRLTFGSSIGDMLALSRASILVGAANSTFSMWASYLGGMPSVWHPTHRPRGEGHPRGAPHITHDVAGDWRNDFLAVCASCLARCRTQTLPENVVDA